MLRKIMMMIKTSDSSNITPAERRWKRPSTAFNSHLLIVMLFVLWAISYYILPSVGSSISHYTYENVQRQPPLTFTENGTFQIAIFNDLHFGEGAAETWGPQQDLNTIKVMNSVFDAEDPQLVVLNGDLITGENAFLANSTIYIDQMVKPMLSRNLPWASTYGNHDSGFNLSRESILARERLYTNSLTTKMVFNRDAGVTNYYLPVYPHKGSTTPCLILWFFDSQGGSPFQQSTASENPMPLHNWVDQSVVDWFRTTHKHLTQRHQRIIPSLAFVHIPVNASVAFQTEAGVDPHHQPGINDDNPLAQQAQGWCSDGTNKESCAYGGQDVPFMEAIVSTPGLMALFSGHDHGNSWCYRWDKKLPGMSVKGNGINLCFGQHSGYGGYGTWTRGARQVLVTEAMLQDHVVDSWIRLETGDLVGSVQLNKTYNEDKYPATPDTHSG